MVTVAKAKATSQRSGMSSGKYTRANNRFLICDTLLKYLASAPSIAAALTVKNESCTNECEIAMNTLAAWAELTRMVHVVGSALCVCAYYLQTRAVNIYAVLERYFSRSRKD